MKQIKSGRAVVRVHGEANQDNAKKAAEKLLKATMKKKKVK